MSTNLSELFAALESNIENPPVNLIAALAWKALPELKFMSQVIKHLEVIDTRGIKMSPTRLSEIKDRLGKVMDEPWAKGQSAKTGEWFVEKVNGSGEEQAWIANCGRCDGEETANFIAHARTDLPDAIERIEYLEAVLRAIMERKGPYSKHPLNTADSFYKSLINNRLMKWVPSGK